MTNSDFSQAADDQVDPAPGVRKSGKRLIVFADGTGNAFGGQASNIWRLYNAIDKRDGGPEKDSTQLARYIPGVGTSSIGLIRAIDGATGFGVPSNVLKLYRFLCWNWEPGDEIWMFGFSRGAFTVRTLCGLIKSQGLMPKVRDGQTVSTAEMARNSKGAWRAYRQNTAPFRDPETGQIRMSPAVSLWRAFRDLCVRAKRSLTGQMHHKEVVQKIRTAAPHRQPGEVRVRFLGLFDTVEAYGVPVEEIRSIVNFWVWPISFRNRVCSSIVEEVRHALSLDDERLTFHPLRFDQSPEKLARDNAGNPVGPAIKEVWFAGVHADVGGGYPNDEVAYDPLVWMIEEAQAANLRLIDAQVEEFEIHRSKNALIHDSRSGFSSAYRYAPRPVESGPEFGGKPIVHRSVVDKISVDSTGYAPVMLTDDFVLQDAPNTALPVTYDGKVAEASQALVVWRRVANMAFICLLVFLLVFPWTDELIQALVSPERRPATLTGQGIPETISGFIPSLARPWIQSFWNHPWISVPAILATIYFYTANASLRDKIKDTTRRAWGLEKATARAKVTGAERLAVKSGLRLQSMRWMRRLYEFTSSYIIPGLLLLLFAGVLLKALHFAGNTYVTARGALCEVSTVSTQLMPGESRVIETEFSPSSACWETGIQLVQGGTYWIKLEETQPFSDGGTDVPLEGFVTNNRAHVLGSLFKRTSGHWFQPVAQIGKTGLEIVPLAEFSGDCIAFIKSFSDGDAEAQSIYPGCQTGALMENSFTARLTADASGPLFLFVNDVIFWSWLRFYDNNDGSARMTISLEKSRI